MTRKESLRMKSPDEAQNLITELIDAPVRRWRVSLFMPTHRSGPEVRQDPIRLRNLLGEAERQLRECAGALSAELEEMLEPARALVEDDEFWNHQEGGLAVLIDPDRTEVIRVPDSLTERCVVSERFHLKPLLPRLEGDTDFYILALSRNQVGLYRASRDVVEEIPLQDIPASLEHALGFEKQHDSQQGHVGHRQGREGHVQVHGHGEGDDDRAAELRSFLQKVDAGLHHQISGGNEPVVLAGVAEVVATFGQVSKLDQRLVETAVEGNVDEMAVEELHDRAWSIVAELVHDPLPDAVAEYERLKADGHTVRGAAVVKAAAEGRLRTIIAAIDDERWGQLDEKAHEVEEHDDQRPGDDDLVDRAAQLGRTHGAKLVLAVRQDIPDGEILLGTLHS